MKVLAFNCSPKAEKANTSLILNPFLKGLERGVHWREKGRGEDFFEVRSHRRHSSWI
jgi:multimeric flavodoxin WrbA